MSRDFETSPNLKAPLLLSGSAGTAGQVVKSRGDSLPPEWGTDQTGGGSGSGSSAGANLYLNANFV
jgi:hypothetical protein